MSKQSFVTGQVLTAAQLTNLQQTAMLGGDAVTKTASYVLVAADAGSTVAMNSASATTITVNTGLFAAGDTVFIQNRGSGNLTVTAGSATVATAGSLILPQNDAGILYFTATGTSIFYDFIQVGAVSPLTTKGDLYTFGTSDTRLAVGATDGMVLTVDSTEATGLKFAVPSAGAFTQLATGTLSGASVSLTSISSDFQNLHLIISNAHMSSASNVMMVRVNSNTNNQYHNTHVGADPVTAKGGATSFLRFVNADNDMSTSNTNDFQRIFTFWAYTSSAKRIVSSYGSEPVNNFNMNNMHSIHEQSAVSSIQMAPVSGSFAGGTYRLLGEK